MQGEKTYQEKLFTSFRLSERIPENNFYRLLIETLDLDYLYRLTQSYLWKKWTKKRRSRGFFQTVLGCFFRNNPLYKVLLVLCKPSKKTK